MADLTIYETGSGGDIVLEGNDLAMTESYLNMPYLAWFGGNPNYTTKEINKNESEQNFDWFGNSLLMPNEKDIQFNSFLENLLNNIALDSSGLSEIENAAKKDLLFFSNFANIDLNVSLLNDNKISIYLKITKPDNINSDIFEFIWDATSKELIRKKVL